MNLLIKCFPLYLVLASSIAFGNNSTQLKDLCHKSEVNTQYALMISNYKNISKNIVDIISGKEVQDFNTTKIFGINFSLSQTEKLILETKIVIDEKKGFESSYVLSCLTQFGFLEKKNQLIEAEVEYLKLKIELLRKNFELNDNIRQNKITQSELPKLKEEIQKTNLDATKLKNALESDLIKDEGNLNKEKDNDKKEYLNFESELTRTKIKLLDIKISQNKNLEEKISYFEKLSEDLSDLSIKVLNQTDSIKEEKFAEIDRLWLNLSKENYLDLFNKSKDLVLPEIPVITISIPNLNQKNQLEDKRQQLVILKESIIKEYTEKKNQELKLLNRLMVSCNNLRSNAFKSLGDDYLFNSLFTLNFYTVIKNEVVSSPYRIISFFYSKFLYFKEKISLGQKGFIDLASDIFLIICLVIFLITIKLFYQKLKISIDNFLHKILNKSQTRFFKQVLSLWNKIKDNFQSILWLSTLEVFSHIDRLSGFSLLIEFARVYCLAQILRSFVMLFLGSISKLDVGNFRTFKIKADETSLKFKNIYFYYSILMLFFNATVGKVYLYSVTNYIAIIYVLYLVINESHRWESEFVVYIEKKFSGSIVERYMSVVAFFPKKVHATFYLLFTIFFAIFNLIISYTENFEISKKISANLFKKQIVNIEAEEGADDKLPTHYKDKFSLTSLSTFEDYIPSTEGLENHLVLEITDWLEDKSEEHSLVIYGDKGVGKTTLLKKVGHDISQKYPVHIEYAKVPSKTIRKTELYALIKTILKSDEVIEKDSDIYKLDKSLTTKTIIVLDECQNIFISETEGFEAYHSLTSIINLNTENIYWVKSFNRYSWLYIDRAFGRTQYFRNVYELSGWNDLKIKDMILSRHSSTNFKLSFDLLINATRSQDEIDRYASIESKFFKLLWELSRGNPRAALYLWISALSKKNSRTLNVNIPKEAEFEGIEKMPDELMFVISQVLRHENLNVHELVQASNLSEGLIRNSLKIAQERKFLFKDKRNRYMVSIAHQYGLIKYLKLKNFIYGN